jgi:hypothetical protein
MFGLRLHLDRQRLDRGARRGKCMNNVPKERKKYANA